MNENNTNAKNSYIQNKSTYSLDDNNSLSFSTRKNKSTDLTEYYNFMYQYKNDCLAASIEYNKDYYSDRDLKPEESIFFKLTIIPFGETSSPNLKINEQDNRFCNYFLFSILNKSLSETNIYICYIMIR